MKTSKDKGPKHTQGRWYVAQDTPRDHTKVLCEVDPDCTYEICTLEYDGYNSEVIDKDAALIAAAPDLLGALEGLLKSLQDFEDNGRESQDELEQSIYWAEKIISKAKGEV